MADLHHRVGAHHIKRIVREAALDLALLFTAYSATLLVRTLGTPHFQLEAFMFIAFAGVVTLASLFAFGVYHRIWSRTSGHGVIVVFNGSGMGFALVLVTDVFLQPRIVPLSVVIVAQVLAFTGFVAVRYRSRLISGMTWRWNAVWHRQFPKSETRVLIAGAGESGQALAWRLKYRAPGTAFRVIGFVDDDADKSGLFVEGAKVLGTRRDIPQLAKLHDVELIVVAVHNISGEDIRDVLHLCEQTAARIKVIPNLFALMGETKGVQLLRDVQAEDLLGRTTITRHEAVNLSAVTGKVVLVSGAAGSIGSELAQQMSSYDPVLVVLVDNNESGLHDLALDLKAQHPKTVYVPVLGDVTDRTVMASVYEQYQPQIIFHAAAYKHVPLMQDFPGAAIHVNIHGTYCMAELARLYGAERFVLISSDKAVNPSNVMGATKRVCELIMHTFASEPGETLFTAVRFGNVLGSRGSVVPIFNRQIEMGGPITITHPDMTRYFMSIPEAVNLVIHAACLTQGDDIFLLKMGEVIRIVDLAERMIRLRGLRPYFDIPITFTGVRPGEKLDEELYAAGEMPHETVHPHIVLLNSWSRHFNIAAFRRQLTQITQVNYFDCREATEMLTGLVSINDEVAVAAD